VKALCVADRDVFDLALELDALACLVDRAGLERRQRVGREIGREDDELVHVVGTLVGDVERHVAGRRRGRGRDDRELLQRQRLNRGRGVSVRP
jgi:hypothetical protein